MGALALYTALVVWLTWPLAAHVTTHLPATAAPCAYDQLFTSWTLAHETRALTVPSVSLLDTNGFYPDRRTLFCGQVGFAALPVFAPVFVLSGNPALATNLVFLAGSVLSAWALHMVTLAWTGSSAAGLVAAAAHLGTRWVLWDWAPTAPPFAHMQYFPLLVLVAARGLRRWTDAVALVVLVVAQALVDFVYVAPGVFAPLAALAGVWMLQRGHRRMGFALAGILAIALLVLAPGGLAYLEVLHRAGSLNALSRFSVASIDALNAAIARLGVRPPYPYDVRAPILLVIAAGVLVRWRRRRAGRAPATPDTAWRHTVGWVLVGLLITCPTYVSWRGEMIVLPHKWAIDALGLTRLLAFPGRFGDGTRMVLCLLAGLAFAELAAVLPGRGAAAALAVIVLAATYASYTSGVDPLFPRNRLPDTYPLLEPPQGDSPLVAQLRQGHGPVLELPVSQVRPDTVVQARALYRSILHHRPVVNGYSSFLPPTFVERMRLASELPDETAMEALLAEIGPFTLVVHLADLRPPEREAWLAFGRPGGRSRARLVAQVENALVLDVQ